LSPAWPRPRHWIEALLLAGLAVCPAYAAEPAASTAAATAPRKPPLDLKIGDIRRYVDPDLLDTPAEEELEEIVVNGKRPEPLPEQRVVPPGLGAIVYGFKHPTQAWRLFVPDPNVEIPLRSEDDVREPPGQFRGRILAPGAIYD
jgi:hypothetical protein